MIFPGFSHFPHDFPIFLSAPSPHAAKVPGGFPGDTAKQPRVRVRVLGRGGVDGPGAESPISYWCVSRREWMGMGVAGTIVNSYGIYGSFPHSLLSLRETRQ